ncbi:MULTISPECIES: Bax inhibitor-1/YccA family protein [unclassified Saccharibacter]|uniref:Bax inhibitor-1/YccA family protein n=1 Tax=unclassified Saccharibacter TaxID=2648722 RepID=UPI001323E2F9|nr:MULTISPECIES: Bax inhibitor-1/YccA family protein [unclassified Saccharibacter]MXV36221.1 BAX inhibitor (BI)-1/YccA family protein [Saccharibacter sp. EH611]MXV57081.1 BAX inhibitor (BI)-1/YccA family protein [Saccharibacter sp. EH70]MXV66559.1 BAX inhibitor (BI)-1/YccA family protein [Saccharibacter sp. EH60]
MAFHPDFQGTETQQGQSAVDAGLRAYMLRVFNWMAVALLLTSISAYAVVNTSLKTLFYSAHMLSDGRVSVGPTLLGIVAIFAPLAFVLVLSFGVNRLSRNAAQALFLVYSLVMGVSLSSILLFYTGTSVVRTFLITASLYAAISLWGYVTKRSLAGMGSFLFMGLIGLIIAGLVNMFFPSDKASMLISFVGVLIFTGFTAYDTQRIKMSYQYYVSALGPDDVGKMSVYDALSMYLNFVNMFQYLLQFFGQRTGGRD